VNQKEIGGTERALSSADAEVLSTEYFVLTAVAVTCEQITLKLNRA
jgi:hypothetical protein